METDAVNGLMRFYCNGEVLGDSAKKINLEKKYFMVLGLFESKTSVEILQYEEQYK